MKSGSLKRPFFESILPNQLVTSQNSIDLSCGPSDLTYQKCTPSNGSSIDKYHNTPPFRPGGRGSKQLSKAIEQSKQQPQWVMATGSHACFAKIISNLSSFESKTESVFIQPMIQSKHDKSLLVLWEGNLWASKTNKLEAVKVIVMPISQLNVEPLPR